jgi:ABC-2 type transport system permease protein
MTRRPDLLLGGIPVARRFGLVNWLGLATFFRREMSRNFKIWKITLAAPAIRAILFASVFGLAIDQDSTLIGNLPFMAFLIPGLVAVAALERAFESSAFSIVYDKVEGIFGDLAVLPLTPGELVLGFSAAAVSGSLIVSAVVWAALLPFGGSLPQYPLAMVFFVSVGSLMVGLFSQISGLWARKWDYITSVQTFVFLPFVFFSGVFFSLDALPDFLLPVARANPVFYIVDGIRFSLTGQAEVSPLFGALICVAVTAFLWGVSYRLFSVGYRMKS